MAVVLLHPSLCLQASCSGILVWFSHGAALFPYHFPDALYCIFITAEAVSTGPSGYLFWDFYWILNKYVCHWGSLAGFLTYFIEAVLPDKMLTSYFNSNLVSLLSLCTVSYMFALAELHLLPFFFFFNVSLTFRAFCRGSLGAFLQPSPFCVAAQLYLCGRQQVEWEWFSAKPRNLRLWVDREKQATSLQKAGLW